MFLGLLPEIVQLLLVFILEAITYLAKKYNFIIFILIFQHFILCERNMYIKFNLETFIVDFGLIVVVELKYQVFQCKTG